MKKLIGSLFCMMLLLFTVPTSVQSLLVVDVTGDADPFVGKAWLEGGENDFVPEVNQLIDAWNPANISDDDYPLPEADSYFEPTGQSWGGNYQPTTITWEGDWTYLSAKYAQYFDLFYIAGLDGNEGIDWVGNGKNALSHYRLFNPTDQSPVPEPATFVLLGASIVALASLRSKTKK